MDLEELLGCASEIARPSVCLQPGRATTPSAWWRPQTTQPPPQPGWELVLAVHPRVFAIASIELRGWVFVWADGAMLNSEAVVVSDGAADIRDGQALDAIGRVDLPPIDALVRCGPQRVRDWLGLTGWDPTWGINSNFVGMDLVNRYESAALKTHPLWSPGNCVAQIGGWPWRWPDDDEYIPEAGELLVLTIAEAEPWIEVRRNAGRVDTKCRIT